MINAPICVTSMFLVLSVIAGDLTGQALPTKDAPPAKEFLLSGQAESLGFNIKKLESIDRNLQRLVDRKKIVGCSALVMRRGQEVCFGRWGYRDRELKLPVQRDTIFRIYSMTKPVTSVAVMQLVEQGKIDLDASVGDYLPELSNLKVLVTRNGRSKEVPAKRKMTVRDLLRHTSGLSYGLFGNTEVDQQYRKLGILVTDLNLKSTVQKLSQVPLLNQPRSKFHYSISTDVLGRVIEVVSGQRLNVYLRENLFEPLGMEDTFFTVPTDKQERLAQLYTDSNGGMLKPAEKYLSIRFKKPTGFFSGGGGLCSTTVDYQRFCQMLLSRGTVGQQKVLEPETVLQIFTNQLIDIENPPGNKFKFGLGLRIFPNGDLGWGGVAGTNFWVNPEKETSIVFMVQIMPEGRRKYADIVRDAVQAALQ